MNYLKSALKQDLQSELNQTLKSFRSSNFSQSKSNSFLYLDSEAFQSDDSRDNSKYIAQIICKMYQKDKLLTQNSFSIIKNTVNENLSNQTQIKILQTLDKKVQKMKEVEGNDLKNYLKSLSSMIQKEMKMIKKNKNNHIVQNKQKDSQYCLNSLQKFQKNNGEIKKNGQNSKKMKTNFKQLLKEQQNKRFRKISRSLSFDQSKIYASKNETFEQVSVNNSQNQLIYRTAFKRLSSNENSQSVSDSSNKQKSHFSSSDYSFDCLMYSGTPIKHRDKSYNQSVEQSKCLQNQQRQNSEIKDKGFIFFRPKVKKNNAKN